MKEKRLQERIADGRGFIFVLLHEYVREAHLPPPLLGKRIRGAAVSDHVMLASSAVVFSVRTKGG